MVKYLTNQPTNQTISRLISNSFNLLPLTLRKSWVLMGMTEYVDKLIEYFECISFVLFKIHFGYK